MRDHFIDFLRILKQDRRELYAPWGPCQHPPIPIPHPLSLTVVRISAAVGASLGPVPL